MRFGLKTKTAAVPQSLPPFLQGFVPGCEIWEAGHNPQSCADPGCDRLACRGYRIGYQDGYASGYGAGYAAGYSAGSSEK